jgi:hypothetical protein
MAWRLARSLSTLRDQINALSPNRSKVSDGTIGDVAHSARSSDHNPSGGIVHAMDITNDPAHGIVSRSIAEALAASNDPRIKYLISNGQICSGTGQGKPAWVWRKYIGSNPHNHHFHISVKAAGADDTSPWNLRGVRVAPSKATAPQAPPANPVLVQGNKGPDVERLQKLLNAKGAKLTVDSDFGPKTTAAVKAFQKESGLVKDGKVGTYTWNALLAK